MANRRRMQQCSFWSKSLLQRWPEYCKRWIKPSKYWALRHDLSIEDGYIAYMGNLLCIAYGYSIWSHYKGVFQWFLRCVLRQNRAYSGYGITQVESCIPCYIVARSQYEVPAIPTVVPFRPWHRIGIVPIISNMKYRILIWDCFFFKIFSEQLL